MSQLEETLALQLRALKLPGCEREYRLFAHHVGLGPEIKQRLKDAGFKDFRFDFAFPEQKLLIEIQGGAWMAGKTGHTSGSGFSRDIKKAHDAMTLGFNVYACDGALIKSGQAVELIEKLVNQLRK